MPLLLSLLLRHVSIFASAMLPRHAAAASLLPARHRLPAPALRHIFFSLILLMLLLLLLILLRLFLRDAYVVLLLLL